MNTIKNKNFCPLVSNPDAECYCRDLTSASIIQIMNYCKDNFKRCRIYQKVFKLKSA